MHEAHLLLTWILVRAFVAFGTRPTEEAVCAQNATGSIVLCYLCEAL